jgi:hypothetical protein
LKWRRYTHGEFKSHKILSFKCTFVHNTARSFHFQPFWSTDFKIEDTDNSQLNDASNTLGASHTNQVKDKVIESHKNFISDELLKLT